MPLGIARTYKNQGDIMSLYRIVYSIEVLADSPLHQEPLSLKDIAYEITEGHASGQFLDTEVEEVSRERMSELLVAQGSDPSFLLGEEEEESQ